MKCLDFFNIRNTLTALRISRPHQRNLRCDPLQLLLSGHQVVAVSRSHKSGSRQQAAGRRQQAGGRRQEAAGSRQIITRPLQCRRTLQHPPTRPLQDPTTPHKTPEAPQTPPSALNGTQRIHLDRPKPCSKWAEHPTPIIHNPTRQHRPIRPTSTPQDPHR